jgi:hypothetical protein
VTATLTIPRRFNGPPGSAQGGYACGRLAALASGQLDGQARVTLHAPVPLDTPISYQGSARRGYATADDELVAAVSRPGLIFEPPDPVSPGDAASAHLRFAGRHGHPFPTCFACGVSRPGDGLGLMPGPLPGRPGTVACVWTPDPVLADADARVRAEFVWSVLDCPGGWTCDLVSEPRVLASMTARIVERPRAGRDYVITGKLMQAAGRRMASATALYRADGEGPLACATTVWLTVEPATTG